MNIQYVVIGKMAPKDIWSQSLELVNDTLFGQRVFADVTKDLEVGRLPWIIRMGTECHHKCSGRFHTEKAV